MTSRRQLKAAEAIREVVANAILTELRDPRVKDVTVIGVTVSPDMREAKVAVSIMGDDNQQSLSLRGLQNSAGFLQSKIANRIDTRYTPRLQFKIDKGQNNAMVVGELLAKIHSEKESEPSPEEGDPSHNSAAAPPPDSESTAKKTEPQAPPQAARPSSDEAENDRIGG
ncbi:MAG: 30S ribosome-binding factor RbfA [Planctomycetota bacterium]